MSSPVLRTRVPEPLRERVQAAAEVRGETVSAFIRATLRGQVETDGPEQAPDDGEAG